MRIGKRRERVTIQTFTTSQDGSGQEIKTPVTLATVWAFIGSKAIGERYISGGEQVMSTVSQTVVIRYRTDVTVQMQVLWGSRVLQIENAVDADGRKRDLVLMCSEVQF
jgi:SPP1 family predicted phage head-tail adaptor